MSLPQRIYVLPARQSGPLVPRHVAPRQVAKRSHQQAPTEQLVAELLGDDFGPSGPRKRERLNHLTQEEKMDRRKLKNRVAAQNARDKKKERSAKIEDVMHDLVEENRRLRAENEMLRRQNEELMYEREERNQMEMVYVENNKTEENIMPNDENIYSNVVYEEEVVGEVQDRAFESAAFINVPLPWEQARSTNRPRCTDSSKKTISVDTYLTIVSILCNHMDQMSKVMNTSSESSKLSKVHLENSIDSLLSSLKKEETMRHLLHQTDLSAHLQKRVKHFRRVP